MKYDYSEIARAIEVLEESLDLTQEVKSALQEHLREQRRLCQARVQEFLEDTA